MAQNNSNRILAAFATMASLFQSKPTKKNVYSETAFQPRVKGIRNPKDPVKKAAITRRLKAKKLSKLSKPKRRAVYYYNLRHSVKMYA